MIKNINSRRVLPAFTLAEILITLGVIGIVAALTIPTLIANYQKKQAINALKHSYAVVQQLFKMAEAEYGEVAGWPEWSEGVIWYRKDGEKVMNSYLAPMSTVRQVFSDEGENSSNMLNAFMCYHKGITKLQKVSYNGSEWQYLSMNGQGYGIHRNKNIFSLELADGSCMGINPMGAPDGFLSYVYIDTNGANSGPNIAGKDFFVFLLDQEGTLLPDGYDETLEQLKKTGCSNDVYNGSAKCAARIIKEGWVMNSSYPWREKRK